MKMYILLLCMVVAKAGKGQQQQYHPGLPAFKAYIFSIMEDSTNYWSQYPRPPRLTDNMVKAMQTELVADDSAKTYLERLRFGTYDWAIDYQKAFSYIGKKGYDYTLVALAAHWGPDIRLTALRLLNEKLAARLLKAPGKYEKDAAEFLLYLLENNPLIIPGSENSTIHGYYLSNILWNLDLLTQENISQKKNISDWYKNDLQFKTALAQWKARLK